ncbi:glycosyltransferase [Bacillus cereus group sp. BfR-BA-01538]|uniref:glycosyltransferase n=1 Tax=Bacillus cereus group sp. BfR-BA-01538 TaxID=2920373 RepID=UPI001F57417F|nr:glycosyltransferase [Bacillus cereus]
MIYSGIVVLYNPDTENILGNIKTFYGQLDYLFLVDNSEKPNQSLISFCRKQKSECNIQYIFQNGNFGIAHALNQGIKLAKQYNSDWLLTMDQDSLFQGDSFKEYINYIEGFEDQKSDVGLFTPYHKTKFDLVHKDVHFEYKEAVMTSGNFLKLSIIESVGVFREDYFIDNVDHEFCLRLRKNGYKIVQINTVHLIHELGNITPKDFFGQIVYPTNHNYIRRYYISRNRLRMVKDYIDFDKKYCFLELKAFIKETFFIILFERNKISKLKSTLWGIWDFIFNNMGENKKFKENRK